MIIGTEQDMKDFCEGLKISNPTIELTLSDNCKHKQVSAMLRENERLMKEGKLSQGSHLQQGIMDLFHDSFGAVEIYETPLLYPSKAVLDKYPELTGTMTGNLSNCYDPESKLFLFHMRGSDISAPFGFQAAAAGMSRFREHPGITARKELQEEAGILYPQILFDGNAIDCLPFMKAGKIPQLLFSFGFAADLSGFPKCDSLEAIAEFEGKIKEELKNNPINSKEGYHFTLPVEKVVKIAGDLNDNGKFYGPIYDSTTNFMKSLINCRIL
jgi:hypothetical protein